MNIIIVVNVTIFWDIATHVNRRFEGTSLPYSGPKISGTRNLPVAGVHIRTAQRCIPGDGNNRNYRCENLKSYIVIVSS
jgi:hypothetical protein